MSGEPKQDAPAGTTSTVAAAEPDDSGVIPVEVEAPEAPAASASPTPEAKPAEAPAEGAAAPATTEAAAATAPAAAAPAAAAAAAAAPAATPPPAAAEIAEVPVDPVAALEAKIVVLEKEKKDNYDRYLRGAADIENLRKRQRRELEDAKFETRGKVLKEMLPVVDNLERAIEHAAANAGEQKSPIVEGVQLVLRQFTTAFERLEVTSVDALGKPFDPNVHEAISQLESDEPPGTVVQVLQRGYMSGDRLLRPSLVVVAKAKSSE